MFKSYLIGSQITVYTNHTSLKHLLVKKDVKARLIWWILFLQEFYLQIRDKKETDNLVADHVSRLPNAPSSNLPINEHFLDEQLFAILKNPWFADIVNYLLMKKIPQTGRDGISTNFILN